MFLAQSHGFHYSCFVQDVCSRNYVVKDYLISSLVRGGNININAGNENSIPPALRSRSSVLFLLSLSHLGSPLTAPRAHRQNDVLIILWVEAQHRPMLNSQLCSQEITFLRFVKT
jgi:hypothetical protein